MTTTMTSNFRNGCGCCEASSAAADRCYTREGKQFYKLTRNQGTRSKLAEMSDSSATSRMYRSSSLTTTVPQSQRHYIRNFSPGYSYTDNSPLSNVSMIDIPIQFNKSCTECNSSRRLQRGYPNVHSSMPSLWSARGPLGQWPSNVTSITTRSIVRQDPRLGSISESNVYEKSYEQDSLHTTRREEHHHSRKYHSKHFNRYRHSEDRCCTHRECHSGRHPSPEYSRRHSSRRYSEDNVICREDNTRELNQLAAMSEVSTLNKNLEEFEDRLLRCTQLPTESEDLSELVDDLTHLQYKIRFDTSLVDRLLYNVEKLQYKSSSHLEPSHVDNKNMIHSISKAIRRWESVATEVDNRQKIAESALKALRKCELLLNSEESWLRGMKQEEDRIRTAVVNSRCSTESALKSLNELINELSSHSHRAMRVNELTERFFETATDYEAKVEQYREQLYRERSRKPDSLRLADSVTSRSSAYALRGRVERFNREYTDLLNSCDKLKQQLTKIASASEKQTLSHQDSHNIVISTTRDQSPRIQEGMTSPIPVLRLQSDSVSRGVELPISNSQFHERYECSVESIQNMCASLSQEALKWLGKQKVIYDPVVHAPSSFVELVSSGRLATTSQAIIPSSPLNRCYILETPERAVSTLSCCIYQPLKAILCRNGGFFINGTDEISLLEAIILNILDLKHGGFRSPQTDRLRSTQSALKDHFVDERGLRNLSELLEILRNLPPQYDAELINGWNNSSSRETFGPIDLSTICDEPLSIQDWFDLNLISESGELLNPTSGRPMSVLSAIEQRNIASDLHEIVFSGSVSKLTLQEAIVRKAIDTGVEARLYDLGQKFNLHEAVKRGLIEKPLTLADAFVQNLVDESGYILHRRTSQHLCFEDAIDSKLLDASCKHIVHPISKALLSLSEAIRLKLIDVNGRFYHPNNCDPNGQSLYEAVKSNKLQLISLKPTIKGAVVQDVATTRMVSVAEALNRGIVDLRADTFCDTRTGMKMSINDATNKGFILPLFHSYMSKVIVSQETQLDGKTIKQCIMNGTVKLSENAICLHFVRATERYDQQQQKGTALYPDDTFTLTIPNAVKYGIISAADGALLREMRGAITREAYITVYVDNISADFSDYSAAATTADDLSSDHIQRNKVCFVLRPPVASIDGFDASDVVSSRLRRHQQESEQSISTAAESLRKLSAASTTDHMTSTHYSQSSQLPMNFIDAVYRQLLNIDTGRFSHPVSHQSLSIREALQQGLINPYTAFIVDHSTDKSYNLQEAVDEGLITEDNRVFDRRLNRTISMAEAMRIGLMTLGDSSLSYYSITSKTESFSIQSVKDTLTGQYIDSNKAIKLDILDLYKGTYLDRLENKRYAIDQAIALGYIIVEGLSDARRSGTNFASGSDKIISTNLIRETRSYNLVGVIDALTRKEMSVQEALDAGILHRSKGQYFDRRKNKWTSISEAIYEGLIKVTLEPVGSSGVSESHSKRAVSETKTYALKGARNTKSNEIISIGRAIEDGIIDQCTGLFYDVAKNETMPISLAVERNLIITEEDEPSVRKHMFYGPTFLTREFRFLRIESVVNPVNRELLSIKEATNKGLLDTSSCSFINPVTGETLSLTEAYSRGYLIGKYISEDEVPNEKNALIAKVCREERSYLVTSVLDTKSQTKVSLHEAIDKGIFNTDRAVYINPLTSEESSLCDAIKHGYVDARTLDGSAVVHQPSTTTKVLRVEKSADDGKRPDKQHDVYKLDTVEEYVESMHSQDRFEQSSRSEVRKVSASSEQRFPCTTSSVSHSTYHTVHRKERNVKERDIVIQSAGSDTAGQNRERVGHIEEIVIDGKRGERVIDVTSTPCLRPLPIVIEDSKPVPASQIIVVDEGPDFSKEYTSNVQIERRRVRVDSSKEKEILPSKTTTTSTEVITRVREVSKPEVQKDFVRLEEGRRKPVTDIDSTTRITTEVRQFDEGKPRDVWSQQSFVEEILNKAKDYKSSAHDGDESFVIQECTYISKGLLHTLSWVLEPETKTRISLAEGIERRIFNPKNMTYHDTINNKYYGTEDAVRLGLIGTDEDCSPVSINADGITYTIQWVLDPTIKQRILPRKAVDKGVLDINQKRYFNPQNNVSISIHEAVKMKFIGAEEQRPDSDEITVTIGGRTITFSWVLDAVTHKRLGAYDALKRGLVDISAGVYFKQDTGDVLTLWDALLAGFIGTEVDISDDAHLERSSSAASLDEDELTISTKTATYVITGVIHPITQQELKVSEAIDLGVLDKNTGAYRDLSTGVEYELSDAINDGLMYATIIESKETTEMETSSIKHVFQRYIINKVIDPRNGKSIGGLQARAAGILNFAQGLYTDPDTQRGIPIREAIDKTLIEVELVNQTSDEQFELDLIKDSLLERRITVFSIYNVVDPVIEENISAQEAVNRGILDSDTKTYFNAANGQYYELHDALAQGLIQADVKEHVMRKPLGLSLQNAARLGFYNYDTGKFKDPCSEEIISLNEAVDKGHIHINGPAIASVNNLPISLRDAFSLRLISRTSGKLERERLQKNNGKVSENRIYRMNIEDAVRCGLLDLHTGLYKHIHTGERLPLKEAISRGLLDGDSVIMEHPVTGTFITLAQALKTIIIDKQGALTDLQGQRITSTLDKEFNQRRLFSAFNVNTGELFIPRLGEMISFEKYVQRNMSEVKFQLYHFKTDREYNITEAIEHGIVDGDTGKIYDNYHQETMSLREAIRRGFIAVIGAPVVPFKADHDALAVRVTSRKRRLSSRTRSGGIQSVASGDMAETSDTTHYGYDHSARSHTDVPAMENLRQRFDHLKVNESTSRGAAATAYYSSDGAASSRTVHIQDKSDGNFSDSQAGAHQYHGCADVFGDKFDRKKSSKKSSPYVIGVINETFTSYLKGSTIRNDYDHTNDKKLVDYVAFCSCCPISKRDESKSPLDGSEISGPNLYERLKGNGEISDEPGFQNLSSSSIKHFHVSSVFDSKYGVRIPFSVAVETGLYDPDTCVFVDRRTKTFLTLSEAKASGLLTIRYFDEEGKSVTNEDSQEVRKVYVVGVKEITTERFCSILEAVELGILDYLSGTFKFPVDHDKTSENSSDSTQFIEITFEEAEQRGLLQLVEGPYDEDNETYKDVHEKDLALGQNIENLSNDATVKFFDRQTNSYISLQDALQKGIVDGKGFYVDLQTNLPIKLQTALRAGLAISDHCTDSEKQSAWMGGGTENKDAEPSETHTNLALCRDSLSSSGAQCRLSISVSKCEALNTSQTSHKIAPSMSTAAVITKQPNKRPSIFSKIRQKFSKRPQHSTENELLSWMFVDNGGSNPTSAKQYLDRENVFHNPKTGRSQSLLNALRSNSVYIANPKNCTTRKDFIIDRNDQLMVIDFLSAPSSRSRRRQRFSMPEALNLNMLTMDGGLLKVRMNHLDKSEISLKDAMQKGIVHGRIFKIPVWMKDQPSEVEADQPDSCVSDAAGIDDVDSALLNKTKEDGDEPEYSCRLDKHRETAVEMDNQKKSESASVESLKAIEDNVQTAAAADLPTLPSNDDSLTIPHVKSTSIEDKLESNDSKHYSITLEADSLVSIGHSENLFDSLQCAEENILQKCPEHSVVGEQLENVETTGNELPAPSVDFIDQSKANHQVFKQDQIIGLTKNLNELNQEIRLCERKLIENRLIDVSLVSNNIEFLQLLGKEVSELISSCDQLSLAGQSTYKSDKTSSLNKCLLMYNDSMDKRLKELAIEIESCLELEQRVLEHMKRFSDECSELETMCVAAEETIHTLRQKKLNLQEIEANKRLIDATLSSMMTGRVLLESIGHNVRHARNDVQAVTHRINSFAKSCSIGGESSDFAAFECPDFAVMSEQENKLTIRFYNAVKTGTSLSELLESISTKHEQYVRSSSEAIAAFTSIENEWQEMSNFENIVKRGSIQEIMTLLQTMNQFYQRVIGHGKPLESLRNSCDALVDILKTFSNLLPDGLLKELQDPVNDLSFRHSNLTSNVSNAISIVQQHLDVLNSKEECIHMAEKCCDKVSHHRQELQADIFVGTTFGDWRQEVDDLLGKLNERLTVAKHVHEDIASNVTNLEKIQRDFVNDSMPCGDECCSRLLEQLHDHDAFISKVIAYLGKDIAVLNQVPTTITDLSMQMEKNLHSIMLACGSTTSRTNEVDQDAFTTDTRFSSDRFDLIRSVSKNYRSLCSDGVTAIHTLRRRLTDAGLEGKMPSCMSKFSALENDLNALDEKATEIGDNFEHFYIEKSDFEQACIEIFDWLNHLNAALDQTVVLQCSVESCEEEFERCQDLSVEIDKCGSKISSLSRKCRELQGINEHIWSLAESISTAETKMHDEVSRNEEQIEVRRKSLTDCVRQLSNAEKQHSLVSERLSARRVEINTVLKRIRAHTEAARNAWKTLFDCQQLVESIKEDRLKMPCQLEHLIDLERNIKEVESLLQQRSSIIYAARATMENVMSFCDLSPDVIEAQTRVDSLEYKWGVLLDTLNDCRQYAHMQSKDLARFTELCDECMRKFKHTEKVLEMVDVPSNDASILSLTTEHLRNIKRDHIESYALVEELAVLVEHISTRSDTSDADNCLQALRRKYSGVNSMWTELDTFITDLLNQLDVTLTVTKELRKELDEANKLMNIVDHAITVQLLNNENRLDQSSFDKLCESIKNNMQQIESRVQKVKDIVSNRSQRGIRKYSITADVESDLDRLTKNLRKNKLLIESLSKERLVERQKTTISDHSSRADIKDNTDFDLNNLESELASLSSVSLVSNVDEFSERLQQLKDLGTRLRNIQVSTDCTEMSKEIKDKLAMLVERQSEARKQLEDFKKIALKIQNEQDSVMKKLQDLEKELDSFIFSYSDEPAASPNECALWLHSIRSKLSESDISSQMLHDLLNDPKIGGTVLFKWILNNNEKIDALKSTISTKIDQILEKEEKLKSIILQNESVDCAKLSDVSLSSFYSEQRLEVIVSEIFARANSLLEAIEKLREMSENEMDDESANKLSKLEKESQMLEKEVSQLTCMLTSASQISQLEEIAESVCADVKDLHATLEGRRQKNEKDTMDELTRLLDEVMAIYSAKTQLIAENEPVSAYPDKLVAQHREIQLAFDDVCKGIKSLEHIKSRVETMLAQDGHDKQDAANQMLKTVATLCMELDNTKSWLSVRAEKISNMSDLINQFWNDLTNIQNSLDSCAGKLDLLKQDFVETSASSIPQTEEMRGDDGKSTASLEAQRQEALQLRQQIQTTDPSVLNSIVANLKGQFDTDEVDNLCDQIEEVQAYHSFLVSEVDTFLSQLDQYIEKNNIFYGTLLTLSQWISKRKDTLNEILDNSSESNSDPEVLSRLYTIQSELDSKAFEIDDLQSNLLASEDASELTLSGQVGQDDSNRQMFTSVLEMWHSLDENLNQRIRIIEEKEIERANFAVILLPLEKWLTDTLSKYSNAASATERSKLTRVVFSTLKPRERLLDSLASIETGENLQRDIEGIKRLWARLVEVVQDNTQSYSGQNSQPTENLGNEVAAFISWLQQIEQTLKDCRETGGLPGTITPQLQEFMESYNQAHLRNEEITNLLERMSGNPVLEQKARQLADRWNTVQKRLDARRERLEQNTSEVLAFDKGMKHFLSVLSYLEKNLVSLKVTSRNLDTLAELASQQQEFESMLNERQQEFIKLDNLGTKIRFKCRSSDSIMLKNLLLSTRNRWGKLMNRWAERGRTIQRIQREVSKFHEEYNNMIDWLDESINHLEQDGIAMFDNRKGDVLDGSMECSHEPTSVGDGVLQLSLPEAAQNSRLLLREIDMRRYTYDELFRFCARWSDACSNLNAVERANYKEKGDRLKSKWHRLNVAASERRQSIDSMMLIQGKVVELTKSSINWLNQVERLLTSTEGQCNGDIGTVEALCDRYQFICSELLSRQEQFQMLLRGGDHHLSEDNKRRLDACWDRVKIALEQRGEELNEALDLATTFENQVNEFIDWSDEMEQKIVSSAGEYLLTEKSIQESACQMSEYLADVMTHEKNVENIKRLAQRILAACHPEAVELIQQYTELAESRMTLILDLVNDREEELKVALERIVRYENLLEELTERLTSLERSQDVFDQKQPEYSVQIDRSEAFPTSVDNADSMLAEAEYFTREVQSLEILFDKIIELQRKSLRPNGPPADSRCSSSAKSQRLNASSPKNHNGTLSNFSSSSHNILTSVELNKEINVSDMIAVDDRLYQPYTRLKSARQRANQRIADLRSYMERLRELDAIKSFDFDSWCSNFRQFLHDNPDKVIESFHRMDPRRTGKVNKNDFVHSIARTKFPTNKIETEMVADIFDSNDDGLIDYKDFLSTFQLDREVRRRRDSDVDKIKQELSEQCSRCRCLDRYHVHQVAEGRYRFGNARRFRLVRILRSTVMVRVGGGWVSLAEFLTKNDPCRAQGRTNLELRDQLLLASKEQLTDLHDISRPLNIRLSPISANSRISTPISCISSSNKQHNYTSSQFGSNTAIAHFSPSPNMQVAPSDSHRTHHATRTVNKSRIASASSHESVVNKDGLKTSKTRLDTRHFQRCHTRSPSAGVSGSLSRLSTKSPVCQTQRTTSPASKSSAFRINNRSGIGASSRARSSESLLTGGRQQRVARRPVKPKSPDKMASSGATKSTSMSSLLAQPSEDPSSDVDRRKRNRPEGRSKPSTNISS